MIEIHIRFSILNFVLFQKWEGGKQFFFILLVNGSFYLSAQFKVNIILQDSLPLFHAKKPELLRVGATTMCLKHDKIGLSLSLSFGYATHRCNYWIFGVPSLWVPLLPPTTNRELYKGARASSCCAHPIAPASSCSSKVMSNALYIKEVYQLGQSSQELPLFPVKTQNKNFKFKDQTRQETVEKGAVMERYQLGGGSAVIHESPEILTNLPPDQLNK